MSEYFIKSQITDMSRDIHDQLIDQWNQDIKKVAMQLSTH